MCKMKPKAYIFNAIFFILCLHGEAQLNNDSLGLSDFEFNIEERLPPIAELQEKAINNSPLIKFYNADVEAKEFKTQAAKREWMNNVGIEGGAKYGLFDNLVLTQDLGAEEITTAKTEQTRYYFGAFVKIPLSSIADKSNVNAAKSEAQKMKYQKQQNVKELKKLIISQYYDVIRAHRYLVIRTNAVESYRVQMLRAKLDFENNLISVSEFARLNDMLLNSITSLEGAKIDFETAFRLLEETIGEKIKLKSLNN